MDDPETARKDIARQEALMRGLMTLLVGILFAIAETVLWVTAILQFLWMVGVGRHNPRIATFGDRLGNWLAVAARFMSGTSDVKPFPWTDW